MPQQRSHPGVEPPDAVTPAPETDAFSDDVERALLQARALVDAAMSNHRRRSTTRSLVELSPDDETVHTTLRRLVAVAREELICIPSAARCGADTSDAALAAMGRLPGAGIPVRMLCPPETLLTPNGLRFLEQAKTYAIQTRVAESPLHELVMVDDRVALVHSNLGGARQQAMVAYAPAILHTLRALFTGAWQAAIPAADCGRFGVAECDRLTRQILVCLSAGYKDDAAARKLGLSVRTYRRYVAEIMRDMGAASRFQAGARAAELGLLTRPDDAQPMPPSTWKTAPVT